MTYTDVLDVCSCGHYAYTHQVRGSKPRGECYHVDDTGPCKCRTFVSTVDEKVVVPPAQDGGGGGG